MEVAAFVAILVTESEGLNQTSDVHSHDFGLESAEF